MADDDDRSWAEKRIDARRAEKGLSAKGSATSSRLATGLLLAIIGGIVVVQGGQTATVVGVVLLAAAAYQLLTAAIASGVREGRDHPDR